MDCSGIQQEATQTIIVCVASSFPWVSLLTPAIIFLSATAAAWGVISARATARKRATLDMIEKVESTPHYRDMHAIFSYHRRRDSFELLHDPQEERDSRERTGVNDYLNHYEIVSIGIRKGILDTKIYQDWMKGPFIRDWNAASSFVQRERWKWDKNTQKWEYRIQLFENYQAVASLWSKEAITLTAQSSPPPERPQGPGDESLPDGNNPTPDFST